MSDIHALRCRYICRLTMIALLALATTMSLAVTPAWAVQDLDAEQQFIELINADRTEAGLQGLAPVADVRDVALAWSHTMADNRVMEHNPSYSSQFCCWRGAAENVGWTTIGDMSSPEAVSAAVARLHQAFMDSPGHRKNLMNPGYDHIGLAIEMRADSCPDGVSNPNCMWVTETFRQWDGTQPAGGLSNPYDESGSRDPSGDDTDEATVSDRVHDGGFDGDVTTVERLGAPATRPSRSHRPDSASEAHDTRCSSATTPSRTRWPAPRCRPTGRCCYTQRQPGPGRALRTAPGAAPTFNRVPAGRRGGPGTGGGRGHP